LDITTFELFVEIYQAKEDELQKINKYLPSNKLRSIEFALKIGNYKIYPSQGIGRVVLTQKSIYFIEQGTNKRKLLTDLKNIQLIEKSTFVKGVFQTKPALKIMTDSGVFFLCAKNEINLWFLLINELCSAIYLSNEMKDESLIQYAAKNVILLDVLVTSGWNEETMHHENVEKSANYLCYYSILKEDSRRLPIEVKEILHLRLNPSQREFNSHRLI
jgi:hypothetical protein